MLMERWLPIVGWPDYHVSSFGRVKSTKHGRQLIRKTGVTQQRYHNVTLVRSPHERKAFYVHRLVLEAFVGPCPIGEECRHLDGDKNNNRLDNLAWGTRLENAQDGIRHGTTPSGDRHYKRRAAC